MGQTPSRVGEQGYLERSSALTEHLAKRIAVAAYDFSSAAGSAHLETERASEHQRAQARQRQT